MTALDWPVAHFGSIERLSVLAKVLPGSAFAVRRVGVPFEAVWTYIEDLERAIPSLDALVGTFEVIASTIGSRRG